jgi:two-component system response regulator HydG
MPSQGRVLLIEKRTMPGACLKTLDESGLKITTVDSTRLGLEKAQHESFDVALLSLETLAVSNLGFLIHLKQESPNTAIVILYKKADRRIVDEAIRNGAFDCLAEPLAPETLSGLVLKAAGHSRRALEDSCVGQELDRMMLSQVLIGRSEAMRRIGRFIRKAASVDATVMVSGEPGTGKEVVARAVHRLSHRSRRPFVTVDCRKYSGSLLENELFGYLRETAPMPVGRMSGKLERAEGGTLFLDEIADIGSATQKKLLQWVLDQKTPSEESGPYRQASVRIISATCRDMSGEMEEGRFREDLFYRLNAISIPVPPLRERLEDIPLLAEYYIRKFSTEKRRPSGILSEEALRFLQRREWPGNVRELIDVLRRAVESSSGNTIEPRDLPPEAGSPNEKNDAPEGHLARMEKNEILRILEQFQGNKTKAAKYLGINRKTLREKMDRYGLNKK